MAVYVHCAHARVCVCAFFVIERIYLCTGLGYETWQVMRDIVMGTIYCEKSFLGDETWIERQLRWLNVALNSKLNACMNY